MQEDRKTSTKSNKDNKLISFLPLNAAVEKHVWNEYTKTKEDFNFTKVVVL